MNTYFPHQYPTRWDIDPQTQITLAGRPEKYYAVLIRDTLNPQLEGRPFAQELQKYQCYLMVYSFSEASVLSDFSQSIIAAHFGLMDVSLPPSIRTWILGVYAALNRPLFLFHPKEWKWDIPFGSFLPSLSFAYHSQDHLLEQWRPTLPSFFKNLRVLNDFQTSMERFLEQALRKLDSEQLRILRFLLLLDKNPYGEEDIIAPIRNYSERCLDIFLSDWSESLVSLGLLNKKQVEVRYGGMTTHYYFSDLHIPLLRKLLFHQRYFEAHEW